MKNKIKLVIFDVNETLLDLTGVKKAIDEVLESSTGFEQWFALLLHYSLVETVTGHFQGFGNIAKATLQMSTGNNGIEITDTEIESILALIKNLPPHADVIEGLQILQESGLTLVALTNGTLDVAKEQLKFAKLDKYMSNIFSVESCQAYKPHPATYQFVIKEMQVEASEAIMVAAHAWDITGAQRAGLQGCFLARKGNITYPLDSEPRISERDLIEAAKKLLKI